MRTERRQAPPPRAGHGGAHRSRGPRDRYAPAYDLVAPRSPNRPLRARLDPAGLNERLAHPQAERHHRRAPQESLLRRLGWRAWAIPLLILATAFTVVDVVRQQEEATPLADRQAASQAEPTGAAGDGATASAAPKASPSKSGIYVDSPAAGGLEANLPSTALPPGGPFTSRGAGTFTVVPGESKVYGTGGPLQRYLVEVERGVTEDGPLFAAAVEKTLGDARSWGAGGRLRFQRVDSGPVDFRVSVTSSLTVRKLCGYDQPYETSCYNGGEGRAVINDARWVRGAVAYGKDLSAYRVYVINHEVGHALGHGHEQCSKEGAIAPVMMQQTLGLTTPGVGTCKAHPWPYG